MFVHCTFNRIAYDPCFSPTLIHRLCPSRPLVVRRTITMTIYKGKRLFRGLIALIYCVGSSSSLPWRSLSARSLNRLRPGFVKDREPNASASQSSFSMPHCNWELVQQNTFAVWPPAVEWRFLPQLSLVQESTCFSGLQLNMGRYFLPFPYNAIIRVSAPCWSGKSFWRLAFILALMYR